MHGLYIAGCRRLSCYMHMLCVPFVFHVSWTLTKLTCGAKKHVSVGSVVRSL